MLFVGAVRCDSLFSADCTCCALGTKAAVQPPEAPGCQKCLASTMLWILNYPLYHTQTLFSVVKNVVTPNIQLCDPQVGMKPAAQCVSLMGERSYSIRGHRNMYLDTVRNYIDLGKWQQSRIYDLFSHGFWFIVSGMSSFLLEGL